MAADASVLHGEMAARRLGQAEMKLQMIDSTRLCQVVVENQFKPATTQETGWRGRSLTVGRRDKLSPQGGAKAIPKQLQSPQMQVPGATASAVMAH